MIVNAKPIKTNFPASITGRISVSGFPNRNHIIITNFLDYDKVNFYDSTISFGYQKNSLYNSFSNTPRTFFWITSDMSTYVSQYEDFEKPTGFKVS